MEHLDETIISLRKEQYRAENTSIEKGFYIKDILTTFHEIELLDKFKIMLPVDFITMDKELAKIKYPSEERPQIIKTNEDTSVNIGFNLLPSDKRLRRDDIEKETTELRRILKKLNSSMEFYNLEIEQLESFNLAWFDYKNSAIDDDLYNIMFIAGISEKEMLHGIFNCSFSDYKDWKTAAIEMLKTIKLSN